MRLTLLGGFLGSGKTTWLRHRLRGHDDTLVVVNEFAGCAVDDVLLAAVAPTTVIAGGCCCCTHRDELVAVLRDLAEQRHAGLSAGLGAARRVVLETSGMADPAAVAQAIAGDPVLVSNLVLDEIVVTVDAVHGADQLEAEPLAVAQAACADRIVITKADAAGTDDVARLAGRLAALAPRARLEAAVLGEAVALPEPVAPAGPAAAAAAPAAGATAPAVPVAVTLTPGPETGWPELAVWLSALLHHHGDRILRVKGLVRTEAGRMVLQAVGPSVQRPELARPGADGDDGLVLIGRDLDAALLARSLRAFAAPARVLAEVPGR
ncbi:GTP-binding protein [Baekduia soli]|uniref:GTP-binding protein n=1 Tax=Baekduia soli TaxID=496014 RepID=A0A5B8UBM6_9ACTN|nr:GTP-binding protein [Baekduia soli]